jgi:hypothetical protein
MNTIYYHPMGEREGGGKEQIPDNKKLTTLKAVVDWIDKDIADHEKEFCGNLPIFVNGAMTALKNLKYFIDLSPSEPVKEAQPDADELWDEFSEHIDDDSATFSIFADTSVITKSQFRKLFEKYLSLHAQPKPAVKAETEDKKIAINTIWKVIEHFQEGFKENDESMGYPEIESELYDIMEVIAPTGLPNGGGKEAVSSLPGEQVEGKGPATPKAGKDFYCEDLGLPECTKQCWSCHGTGFDPQTPDKPESAPPSVESDQKGEIPEEINRQIWLGAYEYATNLPAGKTRYIRQEGYVAGAIAMYKQQRLLEDGYVQLEEEISNLRASGQSSSSQHKEIERRLREERDEYKEALIDLNAALDDIWNTRGISKEVPEWVIKRICFAQQKSAVTFTNNKDNEKA